MFSIPQPTKPVSEEFVPLSSYVDLGILVQCLVIADKYEIKAATSRLRGALSRIGTS
jgi:hypothetical protein